MWNIAQDFISLKRLPWCRVFLRICCWKNAVFYTQSSRLSIQLNSFSRIETKIWNEMPLTLRNLSKHDFKRKITRVLFNILSSEDSYLNIQNIIQKAKFSSAFNVLLYQRFSLCYRIYWVCNAHVVGATRGSEGVVFWRALFVKINIFSFIYSNGSVSLVITCTFRISIALLVLL